MDLVASGLRFPEGPIAMDDGSVILVEIERGTLSRVSPGGEISVIAELGGGPNGAAIGPDGACYVCNNGGFAWHERDGLLIPGHQPADYSGGRIERVDLQTGDVTVLYTEVNGNPLRGPNDLVFDAAGGFWFTDHGKTRSRDRDQGGIYYAKIDGSSVEEVIYPVDAPNGIGLSPDEKTVFFAETHTGRVWAADLAGPGQLSPEHPAGAPGRLVTGLPGFQLLDSLAITEAGNVAVATLINGGITTITPDGSSVAHTPFPDFLVTNICFAGDDMKTAYVTCSGTGTLYKVDWPEAGLKLNFLNK